MSGEETTFKTERIADMVGEEHVETMLESYADSLGKALSDILQAWREEDISQVKMLAHKMKSSTYIVGADELVDRFKMIELSAEAKQLSSEMINDMAKYANSVLSDIRKFLSGSG